MLRTPWAGCYATLLRKELRCGIHSPAILTTVRQSIMTRILIADDHEVVRSGLRSILEAHSDWKIVAEAANGKEAIKKALETKPDVAVIDYSLPLLNGIE